MALVRRGAVDRHAARAIATLAGVGPRAGVPIGACTAIGLGGVRAGAGGGVASPGVMALVRHGADNRISTRAHAALAGVGPRAGVPIGACAAVWLGGVRTGA